MLDFFTCLDNDNESPFQSEFCEIKKKYDAARERLENDVKDITELIQVKN